MLRDNSGNRVGAGRGSKLRAVARIRVLLMLVLCGLLVTSTFQARALEPGDTTPAPAQETPAADGTTNPSPSPDAITSPSAQDAGEPGDPAPSPADTTGSPGDDPESTKAPEPAEGQESPSPGGSQSKAIARGAEPQLRAATCDPAMLFGVVSNGRVWSAEEASGATASVGSWGSLYSGWTPSYSSPEQPVKAGVNGLAVAADGTMYAYARGYANRPDLGSNYNVRVRMMVKEPGGSWQWLNGNTTLPYSYEVTNLPIAGTVDPKTGHYVWGGFRSGYFVIRELNPATGKSYVTGRVYIGSGAANGDIAFDKAGNLYIVGQGSSRLYVTTVTAANLAANRTEGGAYNSWPANVTPGTTVSRSFTTQVNGIAVGEHGDLYVSTPRYIYQINPLTAATQRTVAQNPHYTTETATTNHNTDLASCASNSPTTLTVQKDLRDSGATNDQFTLTVRHEGAEVASVTGATRVTGTSVLQEKTGPNWVAVGAELSLSESGANLSKYDSTLSCVIDGTNTPVSVSGGTGSSGSITVPEAAGGKNITCTFTNTPRATGNAFVCSPGEVYSLDAYSPAIIRRVNTSTRATTVVGSFGSHDQQANALGISPDGKTAYALIRSASGTVAVKKYDAMTEMVSTPVPSTGISHNIVAGAVDPLTGNYWAGGRIGSTGNYWAFSRHIPGSNTMPQQFRLNLGHDAGQGDLLFDYQGNMYVLATNGVPGNGDRQNLWMIPAAAIATAVADPSSTVLVSGARKVVQLSRDDRTYHSVAWGSDGYMYAASSPDASDGATRYLHRINPVTGQDTQLGTITNGGRIGDFASCSNPYTLTLKKNITARVATGDQFGLRIGGGGIATNSAAAYGQTSGSNTGLQQDLSAIAGPVPVLPGGQYTITETGIGTTDLAKYAISYVCRDTAQPGQPIFAQSANVTSLPVALPAIPNNNQTGASIECVFTNAPLPELELTKVDATDHGITLSGASFQLWKDVDGDGELDPDVDTKVGGEQTTDASGLITWNTGLAVGDYLLEELAAPNGYTVIEQVTALTLTPGKNTVVVDNARRTGTVAWGKTDNAGERLSGSEWTLTGPTGPNSTQVVIADCIQATAAECEDQADLDHRAGYFSVTGLAWGDYTLTEKTAPAGFLLSSQVHAFTIGTGAGASFEVDLGAVVNHRQPALVIPLTGGLGTDLFLFIGGGFAALLIAGLAYQRLRTRRIQAIEIDPMA